MVTIDLGRLRLRPGELRRVGVEVALDPFVLGGQRYEAVPHSLPVEVVISEASGGTVFTLTLDTMLSGPCMRCLAHAEVAVEGSAREYNDPASDPSEGLRSDYVAEDKLDVSAWARDVIALQLPEQILCRPDCAGLCPVCGKDLNVEPHKHAERELDPRWAPLEQLRNEL